LQPCTKSGTPTNATYSSSTGIGMPRRISTRKRASWRSHTERDRAASASSSPIRQASVKAVNVTKAVVPMPRTSTVAISR